MLDKNVTILQYKFGDGVHTVNQAGRWYLLDFVFTFQLKLFNCISIFDIGETLHPMNKL